MEAVARVDLDPGAILVASEQLVRERRSVEFRDLELAIGWVAWHGQKPDPDSTRDACFVKMTLLGGEGTPKVQDLCLAELGIARETHTLAARALAADGLDLTHRLPLCMGVARDLACEVWVARRIASATRHLSLAEAGYVDAAMAPILAGEQPGPTLAALEAKVIEANPALHAARVAAQRERECVMLGRMDEAGMRHLIARIRAGEAMYVDAMLTHVARILADEDTAAGREARDLDARRAAAFGLLARPAELLALLLAHATDPDADADDSAGEPGSNDEDGPGGDADPGSRSDESDDVEDPNDGADGRAGSSGASEGSSGKGGADSTDEDTGDHDGTADPHSGPDLTDRGIVEGVTEQGDLFGPEPPPESGELDLFDDPDNPEHVEGSGVPDPGPMPTPEDPDPAQQAAPRDEDEPPPATGPTDRVPGEELLDGFPRHVLTALQRVDPTKLVPKVQLYLHLHQAALSTSAPTGRGAVARLEDAGPYLPDRLSDLLGENWLIKVTEVVDLNGATPLTNYVHPQWLKDQVQLLSPRTYFPYSTTLTRHVDYDHVVPYQHPKPDQNETEQPEPTPGQTGIHNAGPLGRFHHRAKTHAGYGVREPQPGTYVWRTPNHRYLIVDATGTRRLDDTPGHALFATDPDNRRKQRHILWAAEHATITTTDHHIRLAPDYTPSHAA